MPAAPLQCLKKYTSLQQEGMLQMKIHGPGCTRQGQKVQFQFKCFLGTLFCIWSTGRLLQLVSNKLCLSNA